MRLKFRDCSRNETDLFINPEFTVETVKMMLCQKAKNVTSGDLVLLVKRSEVSFDLAMDLFESENLSPYLDYRPLVDHSRFKEYKHIDHVIITAFPVSPGDVGVECKFSDGTRQVRVTANRCGPVHHLLNQVIKQLRDHVNKYQLILYFCNQRMDTYDQPLYKYGIVADVTIEGCFESKVKKYRKVIIRDALHNMYLVYTYDRIRLSDLFQKIREATGDDSKFFLVKRKECFVDPAKVVDITDGMTFLKVNGKYDEKAKDTWTRAY